MQVDNAILLHRIFSSERQCVPAVAALMRIVERNVCGVCLVRWEKGREWMSSAKSSLLLILGHVRSILKQFIFICRLVYKKQH